MSRSHAGDVSKVVKESMPEAKVESAGGAGKENLFLELTLRNFNFFKFLLQS